jgi:hypothetical protein
MDLAGTGYDGVDSVQLMQDSYQWRPFVNLQVSLRDGEFLDQLRV